MAPPRSTASRIADTRRRLVGDVDCWVSSAGGAGGDPHLVPLSFLWDGEALLVATPATSRTSRNLAASGVARVGIGPTRDVVLVDGTIESFDATDLAPEVAAAFAAKAGFDPRVETRPYRYFRITPVRIQAWREANELPGRDVMRNGAWVAEA